MQARAAVLFLGLAGLAGLAWSRAAPAQSAGVEAVDNPDGGAFGALDPFGAIDAALPSFDSLAGSLTGDPTVSAQRLSTAGLDQLKAEEGFSATPYPDFKGQSIGYGHLIKPGEDLTYLTEDQGAELLLQDVGWAEQAVNDAVHVPLSPNQFDALVLFAYNVGATAFKNSTLVRVLNEGDYAGAAAQFPRWVNAGGQVNDALVARRAREQALFEGTA